MGMSPGRACRRGVGRRGVVRLGVPKPIERSGIAVQSERAVVAAVRLPDSSYDKMDPFGELRALAEQAGAIVVGELTQNLERPVSATYMGEGEGRSSSSGSATARRDDHHLRP
jgi:hypothetical protein